MKSDESLNEKAVPPANKTAKKWNDIPDGEIDDVSEEIPLESTQTTEKNGTLSKGVNPSIS